jgi:hypothetical protein
MPELGLATHLRPCGDTHLWQTGNMTLMLAAGCQVSKRGPRGKIEINGNGHAGGAISRIGSGRITVTPGSFLILTSGNSTRNHQDELQDACQNQQNIHKWSEKISLGRFSSASSRSWPGRRRWLIGPNAHFRGGAAEMIGGGAPSPSAAKCRAPDRATAPGLML